MLLAFGSQTLAIELADDQRVTHHRGPAALADLHAATLAALEEPFDFPALRQALTPDDRIALLIGDDLEAIEPLLRAVRETLQSAGIAPEAITTLRGPQHDPNDRAELAYLATTKAGRRIYLARPLVEADQVIVISARRYHQPGAESALFPTFSDAATRAETIEIEESREVAWLLGLPFHVQLIDAAGGGFHAVLAGAAEAAREGERQRNAVWQVRVPRRPDTVVVTTTPQGILAALDNAARVVQPNGRIILLMDGQPTLPEGFRALREASDPQEVNNPDASLRIWINAVTHARLSLLSGLEASAADELFASAILAPEQVQRLVARSGDCLILEDGHRSLAVVE
ncbi:MAG: hypothetical protein SNJ82_09375 [Gemmataceae bacterium]